MADGGTAVGVASGVRSSRAAPRHPMAVARVPGRAMGFAGAHFENRAAFKRSRVNSCAYGPRSHEGCAEPGPPPRDWAHFKCGPTINP